MADLKEVVLDPGYYWKIEGYDVFKTGGRYEAAFCGSFLCQHRTLDEVRAAIRAAVFGPV